MLYFVKKSYIGRCRAFPEQFGPQILSFESIDDFGTSEYFSENFDVEAIKMSLVMSIWFIFRRWLKWRAMFIMFLVPGNDVISLKVIFVYYMHSQSS